MLSKPPHTCYIYYHLPSLPLKLLAHYVTGTVSTPLLSLIYPHTLVSLASPHFTSCIFFLTRISSLPLSPLRRPTCSIFPLFCLTYTHQPFIPSLYNPFLYWCALAVLPSLPTRCFPLKLPTYLPYLFPFHV